MISSCSSLSAILFATLAAIATCAPAISLASPTNNTVTTYQCTDSQKWAAPGFIRGDCYKAVASGAFADELTDFGADEVEFYTDAGGHIPFPGAHDLQAVPRKYTSDRFSNAQGRCTMTIAMMSDLKMGDIPGLSPSRSLPYRDVASYQEISTVAYFLLNRCIDSGQTGWFAVGKRDAIGVFWWETGSDIDKSVRAVNALTNTSVTLLPSLRLLNGMESVVRDWVEVQ